MNSSCVSASFFALISITLSIRRVFLIGRTGLFTVMLMQQHSLVITHVFRWGVTVLCRSNFSQSFCYCSCLISIVVGWGFQSFLFVFPSHDCTSGTSCLHYFITLFILFSRLALLLLFLSPLNYFSRLFISLEFTITVGKLIGLNDITERNCCLCGSGCCSCCFINLVFSFLDCSCFDSDCNRCKQICKLH